MSKGAYIFMRPDDFSDFTYSKKSHFELFDRNDYDLELFKAKFDPSRHPVKRYQDLLVFSFIKQVIPPGSRILDIGGGNSRILRYFKDGYEGWNIDKLEGCGHGPLKIDTSAFRFVQDYIGNFNTDLPDDYFEFVFSISALEHVPQDDPALFQRILEDINRVIKPGGFSLHCFDIVIRENKVWSNDLLTTIFRKTKTLNAFIPFEHILNDPDIFVLSRKVYNKNWLPRTHKTYEEFGKPLSYNVLWKKEV
ncbi:MAG: methyltransferase domain-containing protein [Candidatus Aminicenantes bacterium]|nr:methyltransferase domain-containing protein [Candidatus Aminicenantes bacterium]